jgi:dihydropteroate synthase
MGILNVTPDSFADGGRYSTTKLALKRAEEMMSEGVDIIDVGGESTKPGAERVTQADEVARVIPVIKELVKTLQSRSTRPGHLWLSRQLS